MEQKIPLLHQGIYSAVGLVDNSEDKIKFSDKVFRIAKTSKIFEDMESQSTPPTVEEASVHKCTKRAGN